MNLLKSATKLFLLLGMRRNSKGVVIAALQILHEVVRHWRISFLGFQSLCASADDYQKSLKKEDEKKPSSNAFKARATPSNAWSSQTSLASQMGMLKIA